MLSSLEGGVVGSELGLEGTAGLRPRARNCWWSRPGRKGLGGITCIVSYRLEQLPVSDQTI